jgi:hypothetical protein
METFSINFKKQLTSVILICCIFFCQSCISGLPDDDDDRVTESSYSAGLIDKEECTCNGILLKGRVKIVNSFPDLKVLEVKKSPFPDLDVKVMTSFIPYECGEWQFVENFPDFTIQYVDSWPDIRIRFVESFPGMK